MYSIQRVVARALLVSTCWLMIVVSAVSARAQTVRPLISELGNPARGRVEYVNDSLVPLNVLVQAQGFRVSESGDISYMPLESSIHLKLSATSFRIPPKQSYYLFYEAETDHSPAWFVIYATFSGFAVRSQEGMNVRLELPHTVYLLPKKGMSQEDVVIRSAAYDPATNKVVVDVENTANAFDRVLSTVIHAGKHNQEVPGFPIFPQSRRHIEYAWTGSLPPERVQLEFEHFKLEKELNRVP